MAVRPALSFKAPKSAGHSLEEFQRIFLETMTRAESALAQLSGVVDEPPRTTAKNTSTTAIRGKAGDIIRILPAAAGARVLLDEPSLANKGKSVELIVEGAAGSVTVETTRGTVQGTTSVTVSGVGTYWLTSDGGDGRAPGGWWLGPSGPQGATGPTGPTGPAPTIAAGSFLGRQVDAGSLGAAAEITGAEAGENIRIATAHTGDGATATQNDYNGGGWNADIHRILDIDPGVDVTLNGLAEPSVSDDGSVLIFFKRGASNLVDITDEAGGSSANNRFDTVGGITQRHRRILSNSGWLRRGDRWFQLWINPGLYDTDTFGFVPASASSNNTLWGDGWQSVATALSRLAAFSVLNVQVFTGTADTYTPTSGMKWCLVILTASGAGGGGADSDTTDDIGIGGGGGAGGTRVGFFSAATIGASKAVAIPAAGTAGSNAGGTGGNSSDATFGSGPTLLTAAGATGGTGSGSASTRPSMCVAGGNGGGAGSSGLFGCLGGDGHPGIALVNDATVGDGVIAHGGQGGASFWGGGGKGGVLSNAGIATPAVSQGNAGRAPGSGGGGSACFETAAGQAASAGATGICVVIEFA